MLAIFSLLVGLSINLLFDYDFIFSPEYFKFNLGGEKLFIAHLIIALLICIFSLGHKFKFERIDDRVNVSALTNIFSIVTAFGFLFKVAEIPPIHGLFYNLTYFYPFFVGAFSRGWSKSVVIYFSILLFISLFSLHQGLGRSFFMYHIGLFAVGFLYSQRASLFRLLVILISAILLIGSISGYLQLLRYGLDLEDLSQSESWLPGAALYFSQITVSRLTNFISIMAVIELPLFFGAIDLEGILKDFLFVFNRPAGDYFYMVEYAIQNRVAYGISIDFGYPAGPGNIPPVPLLAESVYRGGMLVFITLFCLYLSVIRIAENLLLGRAIRNVTERLFLKYSFFPVIFITFSEWSVFQVFRTIAITAVTISVFVFLRRASLAILILKRRGFGGSKYG